MVTIQSNTPTIKEKTPSGWIFDIRRYSIHDGPGIRTAVFLKGCPLACQWCHNPEGRSFQPELIFRYNRCTLCKDCLMACPQEAISCDDSKLRIDRTRCTVSGECAKACPWEALEVVGKRMTVGQILTEIERDRTFYEQSGGGVTFTGGEPFAQPDFLMSLLHACQEREIQTAVDTSGFAPWEVIDSMRSNVILFLYDLKMMNDTRHIHWTGVSNKLILSNLRRLSELGHPIRVRIPILPGINDDEENIHTSGEFLAGLPSIPPIQLLAYHNIAEGKYSGLGLPYGLAIPQPDEGQIEKCARLLAQYGLKVI